MRASQKSNRSRGRGNRKPSGNNLNRVYESTGPEGKVRGTPQQIMDKYLSLARDAQTSGDRVVAENFLQHAEHYQRILVEAMGARQERRDGQQGEGDQPDYNDGPDGDETPPRGNISERNGSDRNASERNANDRNAQDRNAQDRNAQDRNANDRGGRGNGHDAPRESEVSGLNVIDAGDGDTGSLLVDAEELSASQPKRRPRPRREPAEAAGAAGATEANEPETQAD